MVNNDNIKEEIQELVKQIKAEYQEGIDYKFSSGENALKRNGVAFIVIISPRLKKIFRERFNFPLGVVNHLDYVKMDQEGGNFLYRIHNHYDDDALSSADGRVFPEKEKGENCQVCGNLVFKKNGRMELWDGEKTDGKPDPKIIGYFHPECAKKYFAGKEQPQENNNSRIKEKLLRNLDKICLDPEGYVANNEYLKTDEAEEEYFKMFDTDRKEWKNRFLTITIDGEEIDLEAFDNNENQGYFEVKRELIKKIKSEIKQNSSEWKIERAKILPGLKHDRQEWLVKHQSGRRHWKFGISHMRGKEEYRVEGKTDWAEIEALINGSPLPVNNQKTNHPELEKIKTIFQKLNINKITYENGKLTIEFNDHKTLSVETVANHQQEYQTLKRYCQEHNKDKLTSQELGIGADNNASNSPNSSKPNHHQLVIGLAIGAGAVILIGAMAYLVRKRKKKEK